MDSQPRAYVTTLTDQLEHLSDREFNDVMKSACWRRGRTMSSAEHTAVVVLECLFDLCNGSEREVGKAWWNVWNKQHRTLQQTFVRVFVNLMRRWVKEYTEGGWQPDARNEASYQFAEQLVKDDRYFPFI